MMFTDHQKSNLIFVPTCTLCPSHQMADMMQHQEDVVSAAPQHSLQYLQVTLDMLPEELCHLAWCNPRYHHLAHSHSLQVQHRV